jgi:hypothetical protein
MPKGYNWMYVHTVTLSYNMTSSSDFTNACRKMLPALQYLDSDLGHITIDVANNSF